MLATTPKVPNSCALRPRWRTRVFEFLVFCLPQVIPQCLENGNMGPLGRGMGRPKTLESEPRPLFSVTPSSGNNALMNKTLRVGQRVLGWCPSRPFPGPPKPPPPPWEQRHDPCSGVQARAILGLILAPHARHWVQCLIPTVTLGVTVTVTVTVNRCTIPEGIEGCKCMQGIAGHGLQDIGPWHPGHWDSNNVTVLSRMTEFHVQHP